MTVTGVRRAPGGGLVLSGHPARLDEVIEGRWNASAPIPARVLLAHARLRHGVRVSPTPFPAQRALLDDARGGPVARAAGGSVGGTQQAGFYAQLNYLDLGAIPGTSVHAFLTAYATILPTISVGTDPSGCPYDSCPGTLFHLEAGFSIDLQKAQLTLGFNDHQLTNPSATDLEQLKSALISGKSSTLLSLIWGTLPLDPIEFVVPIGPVPVPVVITQALRFTSDLKMRGLFGVDATVNVGLDVGAGFGWVPGTGPFDPGHLEGIGYVRPSATWGGDTSNSGSLLQTILNKLGGDPKVTTWLGGELKFIALDIHYQPEMYGLVGADLELHLGYVKAQAKWNINQCNISGTVTVGIEGELKALVTLGPTQQTIDTPLQIGYAWPVFNGQIPFIGVGCPPPGSATPGAGSPAPVGAPPAPSPSPSPSPGTPPPPPPPPAPQGYFVYHVHGSCAGSVCGIHERTGPGLAYPIVGSKGEGSEVDIVCQTSGDLVTGTIGGSSAIWDRLTDGYYVADLFVDTPGVGVFSDPPIPHC